MLRKALCATGVAVLAFAVALTAAQGPGVQVAFDEWTTPSSPPYPHDPEFAPDGSVWYTGQRANVIGRLDPATGQFKEFPLPTANSGPHGLTVDRDGNVWYTGNSAALIGKLDPLPPIVAHPDAWLRRRIAIPGQPPWELPTTSKAKLLAAGFEVMERRTPSSLLDGTIVVTGEITRYSRFELSYQPKDILTVRDYQLTLTGHVTARERITGKVVLDRIVTGSTPVRVGADLANVERQAGPLLAQDLAKNVTALLVDGEQGPIPLAAGYACALGRDQALLGALRGEHRLWAQAGNRSGAILDFLASKATSRGFG